MANRPCLLLGKDFSQYGRVDGCELGEDAACAISVGADRFSPSLMFKGDPAAANEDAVLLRESAGRIVMAVADAHFGQWASEVLVSGLAEEGIDFASPQGVLEALQRLCANNEDLEQRSETTLLIVSVHRGTGRGFGLSFGDSSALILGSGGARPLNQKNAHYISPNQPADFEKADSAIFEFQAGPGEMVLLFTDGVDECHYGKPETSISAAHLVRLIAEVRNDTRQFVSRLADLALSGVDGHPGGQDNLVIAACSLC